MDGSRLIAAPAADSVQGLEKRPAARPDTPRADFTATLAAETRAGLSLEAPFRAPPPVETRILPEAPDGYGDARGAFGYE
ncbi:hypothetical protein [Roseivivax sediminis]|uniref:Uncharacterized protein n=1 Tax=Roseivivax sediminis TaxID=936889 RepID=A0A1I1VBJ9_9RHOB|nr:hypothetical protein [Roseivivax sediminis]SFD80392.1 hypothetical protein SAMN04515678_103112 [Roseivivax sediminis]